MWNDWKIIASKTPTLIFNGLTKRNTECSSSKNPRMLYETNNFIGFCYSMHDSLKRRRLVRNEKHRHETESVTSGCVENSQRRRKARCRVSVSRGRRFRGETRLRRFSFIRIINVSGCITPAKCFYYSRVREIPVYAAKLSPRVRIRDPHSAPASIAPQPTSCRLPFDKGEETRETVFGEHKGRRNTKVWCKMLSDAML